MPSRSNAEHIEAMESAASGRPKVGPADPDTVHRLLQQKLAQPTRATGVAPQPAAKPLPGGPVRSTYDQLRLRGKDVDNEVDKRS